MAVHPSQEKAKVVLNPPIWPVPNDEGMESHVPQEKEPLMGPSEARVGTGRTAGLVGGKGSHAFDGKDNLKLDPPHPSKELRDEDFHDGGLSKGTAKALDTGGML